MAKQAPSEQELAAEYSAGVSQKAGKWFKRTMAATGVADAAKSEAAESAYQAQMQRVLANRQRQRGLAGVTDSDIKAGVQAVGASGYSSGATAKAAKMAKKAKRYVDLAVATANALPPRTADPDANIDARVKPIARALRNLKTGGT